MLSSPRPDPDGVLFFPFILPEKEEQVQPVILLLAGAGGALGSVLRLLLQTVFNSSGSLLPWGTLLANLVGCYAGGILLARGAAVSDLMKTFLVSGMLGALTSFSSFAMEVIRLCQLRAWHAAVLYTLLTLIASLLACFAGWFMNQPFPR